MNHGLEDLLHRSFTYFYTLWFYDKLIFNDFCRRHVLFMTNSVYSSVYCPEPVVVSCLLIRITDDRLDYFSLRDSLNRMGSLENPGVLHVWFLPFFLKADY